LEKATGADSLAQVALEEAKVAQTKAAESAKVANSAVQMAVRAVTGGGHDTWARLSNYREVVALFIIGGDDLATAKQKARKFVICPKQHEDELSETAWRIQKRIWSQPDTTHNP